MRAVVRKEYAVASMKEQFPDLEVLTEDADGEILVCEPNLCSREYLEKNALFAMDSGSPLRL